MIYRMKSFGDSYFENINNFYTISIDAHTDILFGCRNKSFILFMQ